jgi:hypothetical protein
MTSKNDSLPGEYVRHVRESTRQYEQDLLAENQRLAGLLSAAQADRVRLQAEAEALRGQLERHCAIEQSLGAQMQQVEQTRHELSRRYVEVEQANSNLANLYVASYGLHRSLERNDVVQCIHEVIVNLVGSEEFAIFERGGDTGRFAVTSSMGVGPEGLAALAPPTGRILATLRDGSSFVRDANASAAPALDDPLVASFPLTVAGRVFGAIAVFRLLPHKAALEPVDGELFDLLATHAASALYCCQLHAQGRKREVGP